MTTTEKKLEIWKQLSGVREELINARVAAANLDEDHSDAVGSIRGATARVESAMQDLDWRGDLPDKTIFAGNAPEDPGVLNDGSDTDRIFDELFDTEDGDKN